MFPTITLIRIKQLPTARSTVSTNQQMQNELLHSYQKKSPTELSKLTAMLELKHALGISTPLREFAPGEVLVIFVWKNLVKKLTDLIDRHCDIYTALDPI